MALTYAMEILQTQAFDVLIQTIYMLTIWGFMTYRLDRIESRLEK
jgi:hypothetical protein